MKETKTAEEIPDFSKMFPEGRDSDGGRDYDCFRRREGAEAIWNQYVTPLKKRIEELEAGYTERELEIAYCIGLLNRGLTMDELSEALKSAKDKLLNLKEAIKRGDFNVNPSTNGK